MSMLTKDKSFYKQFFSLMLFIAMQNLIVYSVSMADNVMLGRYSEEALSGVALANQIQFLLQMVGGAIGDGVVVLSSQYWGKRQTNPLRRILCSGLILAGTTGLIFTVAAEAAPGFWLRLLAPGEPTVVAEGIRYLRIIGFTYVIFCVNLVLQSCMRSVENVRIGMVTSIVALFTNITLNYALIFGHFGMPEMGVEGAAIATLISRCVETGVLLLYVLKIDKKLRLRFSQMFEFDRVIFGDYVKTTLPVVYSGASWGIAMFLQTAILGRMGAASIAANSIAASLFSIISVLAYGCGSAASVLTGKTVGEGDRDKLKDYVRSMQVLFLIIGLICGALIYGLKDLIISFYQPKSETEALARQFLTILSITVIGTAYQTSCLTGIVRGGGNTKFVFYNDLVHMWGIILPVSYLAAFVFHWSPAAVFFCLKADQLLKCVVAVFEVNSYRWVRKLTRGEDQQEGIA